MKRVEQQDQNGCGTACVAIIAGVSYSEAQRRTRTRGSTTAKQLRKALRSYGFDLREKMSLKEKTYSDLKQSGLLLARISRIGRDETWDHWMVWDGHSQAIIDPSRMPISSRRTRLNAFFPVARRQRAKALPYSK
jgi:ABC-type bacteriocin/lantibiotic exporter with double-glycine peptidase domain